MMNFLREKSQLQHTATPPHDERMYPNDRNQIHYSQGMATNHHNISVPKVYCTNNAHRQMVHKDPIIRCDKLFDQMHSNKMAATRLITHTPTRPMAQTKCIPLTGSFAMAALATTIVLLFLNPAVVRRTRPKSCPKTWGQAQYCNPKRTNNQKDIKRSFTFKSKNTTRQALVTPYASKNSIIISLQNPSFYQLCEEYQVVD